MVLAALTLLATGHTLRAEGNCMFPVRGGSIVFAIDAKTGTVKDKELVKLMMNSAFDCPTVSKGVLYVGESNNLLALDATTGKRLWAARGGYGQIVPAEDALFVGGRPRALDPKTGQELWRVESGLHGRASWQVLPLGELLICGLTAEYERNPRVCALERKTGKERWRFPLKGNAAPVACLTFTRASQDLVFAGRANEGYLLDLKSGREVWSVHGDWRDWPARPETPQSQPSHVICAQQVVVRLKAPADAKARGTLEAMEVVTLKTRWQTALPHAVDWDTYLSAVGDLVFMIRKDDVHVFQASDGKLRWQAEGLQSPIQMVVAKESGIVYLLDGVAQLRALDQKTGQLQWRKDLQPKGRGERYLSSYMALVGDTLYLLGNEYFDPRWGRAAEQPEKPPLPR
jgi:outer membrane protein assembly factor BamB